MNKKNTKPVSAPDSEAKKADDEEIKSVIDSALNEAENGDAGASADPEESAQDAATEESTEPEESEPAEKPAEEPKQPEKEEPEAPAVSKAPEDNLSIMHLHTKHHTDEAPNAPKAPAEAPESAYHAPEIPKAPPVTKAQPAPAPAAKKPGKLLAIIAAGIGIAAICVAGYDIHLRSQEADMLKSKAAMQESLVMTVSTDIPVISTKNGLIYSDDPNPVIAKVPDQLRPYIGQYPSEGDLHIDGLEALNLEGTHTITFVLTDTDQYGQTVENTYSMMVEVAEGRASLQTAEPSASPEATATAEASAEPEESAEPTDDGIPEIGVSDTLGPARNTETTIGVTTPEPTATPADDEVTIITDGQKSCEDTGGAWDDITNVCSYN